MSAWIHTPVDGWGSKASIDFKLKALKVACKQRGLTHGNRHNREVTIALLEDFDVSHSIQEISLLSELLSLAETQKPKLVVASGPKTAGQGSYIY
jgi:hypothetical protein